MISFVFRSFFVLTLLLSVPAFTSSGQKVDLKKTGGLKIEKVEGKTITLSFTATIENMSSKGIGVTIKKGKLYKDGDYVGSFKLLEKVKLKNKGTNNLNIKVLVELEKDVNLMKEGLSVLMGKKTELQATGFLKATWFIFWKKFPFEMKEGVSMKGLF